MERIDFTTIDNDQKLTIGSKEVSLADFVDAVTTLTPGVEVPAVGAGGDWTGVGKALANLPVELKNALHTTAMNVVAKILMNDNVHFNPLAEFTGEQVANGALIKEQIIDISRSYHFNPDKSEQRLFSKRPPALYEAIHTTTRDIVNPVTVQDTMFTQIYFSAAEVNRYVVQAVESVVSGNNYERFETTKDLISEGVATGVIPTDDLTVGGTVTSTSKDVQKAILSHAELMGFSTRDYNKARGTDGVMTQTPRANLRLFLPVATKISLNVDFFVNAFNLSAVQSDLAIRTVDRFEDYWTYSADHTVVQADFDNEYLSPEDYVVGDVVPAGSKATPGATGATKTGDMSEIVAVIMDKRKLIINPVIPVMFAHQKNADGRSVKYFLHDKAYFSLSPFLSAVAIKANIVDTPSTTTTTTP